MAGIERRILRGNPVEALGQRRSGFGKPLPAIRRRRHIRSRRQWRLINHSSRYWNDVAVGRTLHNVARRAVIGRPFVSGALSQNIPQTEEDEYGQGQEDNGINIHVEFAFWF
jgi:hypothetical protein